MSESRDPAIKLFGTTIPLPTPDAGEGNVPEDQEPPPADNKKSNEGEEDEEEEEKV